MMEYKVLDVEINVFVSYQISSFEFVQ
jgi:hypothetical protein